MICVHIFEIQVCIELRQKIVRAILKSNLGQQCVDEDSILNSDNRFIIYLVIFSRINHFIDKNQTTFLLPLWFFNYDYSPSRRLK